MEYKWDEEKPEAKKEEKVKAEPPKNEKHDTIFWRRRMKEVKK